MNEVADVDAPGSSASGRMEREEADDIDVENDRD